MASNPESKKQRFLIAVWPFAGHIHPNLAIATHLRERGHEVAFYTGETARRTIESEGFPIFPMERVDAKKVNRIALSAEGILSCQRRPLRLQRMYKEWLLDTVPGQVEDIEAVIQSWHPDGIVSDPTLWAPFLILSEKQRIPVGVFSLIPACYISGKDAPILGMPLARPRTAFERIRARVIRRLGAVALAGTRREASRLRVSYGLPPLDRPVTDFAAQMRLYLVPSSREFDYQRNDLPRSVEYVGPCVRARGASPELEEVKGISAERPWIYVSEGTVHLDPILLRCAAQGLANLPVEVIMTTGRHREPESLDLGPRPLASNIHLRAWVDFDSLLPRLSGVVNVGGPSTIMAALNEAIPVVVVPFAWDHPETGWRVAESGAGVLVTPKKCTPAAIREAVLRILNEPSYRVNAARLACGFKQLGGARRAAELIELKLGRTHRGEQSNGAAA